MLCAEKARQCSSCSATAQLNIAPLVSNRPEILQSAAAIILTLLIQFVSATHRSVPELLRQHSYTVHDLVSCLSLSSQLGRVECECYRGGSAAPQEGADDADDLDQLEKQAYQPPTPAPAAVGSALVPAAARGDSDDGVPPSAAPPRTTYDFIKIPTVNS